MTLYAKSDIRNSVLHDLTVLDVSEEASAEDAAVVDAEVQSVLEYLEDEDLTIFDFTAAEEDQVIPGRIKNALVDMVVFRCQPKYGQRQDPTRWKNGIGALRRSVLAGSDDQPTPINNF